MCESDRPKDGSPEGGTTLLPSSLALFLKSGPAAFPNRTKGLMIMTYEKPEVTSLTEVELALSVEALGAGGGGGPIS